MSFLDLSALGLNVDQDSLLQDWLTVMQTLYPGYVPADGNPEYVDAQGLANLFADGSQAALVVPSAIARAFGTKLYSIPYLPGVAATASVQITAVDDSGYTLPAGTDLTLGVYGFYTQSDLTISPGDTIGTVTVFATSPGSASNGASSPAELMATFDWVSSLTALAGASGGVDAESDDDYQNRLVRLLSLVAPRPITAQDFATMVLSFAPASGTDEQELGRATAIDGYADGDATFTVSLTSGSASATIVTPPATDVYPAQGTAITGTNIPSGTIVLSANTSTITMSQNATGTGSQTATAGGTLGNERTVTSIVALSDGTAPNSDTLTAAETWLASYREANFDVGVIAATYTNVYVTVTCKLYPGFDSDSTAAAIQTAIIGFLSPTTFGDAAFGDSGQWFSGCTIYQSQLMAVVQNAGQGAVQNIVDGSLKFGTGATPTNTADLVLPGPVGLPMSDSSTVTVTIA